jgi:Ca2+-binding RTX toxin-like protein
VNAAEPGGTIHVAAGAGQDYQVGHKPITIAFENGPSVTQQADNSEPSLLSLTVSGTPQSEVIEFVRGGAGVIRVAIDSLPTGSFSPTGRLIAWGAAGDDDISVDGSLTLRATLHGGHGHDRLKGGAGHDSLFGEAGDDLLAGSHGRDLLIGGLGADRLVGNADEDILISGTTDFDEHEAALAAIMAEWSSARSYSQRTSNISGAISGNTFGGRTNGNYFLNTEPSSGPVTVHDDGAKDMLTGAAGQDWFFANLFLDNGDDAEQKDKITDLGAAEFAQDLDFIESP